MRSDYPKNLRLLSFFAILGILLQACNGNLQSPESGAVLFMDDFQHSSGNWRIWFEDGVSAASVVDGRLVLILEKQNTDAITTNNISHPDIEISAKAKKEHGSDNNLFGIICRYINPNNYYSFLISSDGYFGIATRKNGITQLISSEKMQYDEAINKGDAENQLSVTCVADKLQFSVNGNEIAAVRDSDLISGGNGLLIGSFESPDDLVIAFDDFEVKAK